MCAAKAGVGVTVPWTSVLPHVLVMDTAGLDPMGGSVSVTRDGGVLPVHIHKTAPYHRKQSVRIWRTMMEVGVTIIKIGGL